MKAPDKQNKTYPNFTEFLDDWNKRFDNVKNILSYLNTYPDLLNTIKLKNLHDSDSIIPEQEDWVRISAKFDHPLEKDFFKPYWVPIVRDSLDYFIDLSDDTYPIFETHFIFFEPYNWHKKFLVEDISSLLLASDENINLHQILEKNEGKRWEQVEDFFEQRRKMGYAGKLYVGQVKKDELVLEETNDFQVSHSGNSLTVMGASSLIIGLLPFNLEIELKDIEVMMGDPLDNLSDVRLVRDMVFLLRNSGILRIGSYTVILPHTPNNYISFSDNYANFCLEEELIQDLKEKLNTIL